MDQQPSKLAGLNYIKAEGVRSGDGSLGGFAVRDAGGATLGELAGVLVDMAEERLRYLVVTQWYGDENRLGVLSIDGARLDPEQHALVILGAADTMQPQVAA